MKKLTLKMLDLSATQSLSREQMKTIVGGGGASAPLPYCTSCCPEKPCKPRPHMICSDIACQ